MKTTVKFVGFDALKQSVSMAQVLDRYGLLDRLHRSGDSLSGACPIHAGHNPMQFRVSLSKNCWICFGDCHAGGSIVDFVSRKEGIGIRDAALLIQDWFKVQPGASDNNGRNGHKPPYAVSAAAPEPPGGNNRPLGFTLGPLDHDHPYLCQRGLSPETIATFGVGYCSRGMLTGWIAIPIHNVEGKLVAYAGRWPGAPPEGTPKYRLPRGFRKSLELFNLHRATLADRSLPLVVVEGFFGCMRVWQAGHRRVVSLMGSMLSQAQERTIVELAGAPGRVLLLFDEDEAGRKGRAEASARLCKSVSVHNLRLEEGQQPDSIEPQELLRRIGQHAQKEVAR
jgi:DNA primase